MKQVGVIAAVVACLFGRTTLADQTPAPDFEARGFQRLGDIRGISLYRDPDSETVRLAAIGIIDAQPARVRDALIDFTRHAGHVPRVAESRIIGREPAKLRVYQRLDLPVISDRDVVLDVTWGETDGLLWILSYAVAGDPSPKGAVRVTKHWTRWELRPVANGTKTEARYEMEMDLGGSIPGWMTRRGAGDEIPDMFRAIAALASDGV